MHTIFFTIRTLCICVWMVLMIAYGAQTPKRYIYATEWNRNTDERIVIQDGNNINITTTSTTTGFTVDNINDGFNNETETETNLGKEHKKVERKLYTEQDVSENTILGKEYTIEDIGKWKLINKVSNSQCEKVIHEETEKIVKCITNEDEECQTTQYTIPKLWESNFSSACQNDITRQYHQLYNEYPTVTQMCQMNALYIVDVYRKEQKSTMADVFSVDVITEITKSFPVSLLWNSKRDLKDTIKSLEDIIQSEQLSIRDTAVTLCAMLRPINSVYYDDKGQNIVLTTGEYNEFNIDLVNILLNIDVDEQDQIDGDKKRTRLINSITDSGQQLATHKASLVYFFTSDESKESVKKWALNTFSWDDNYHPVYMWNSINRAEDMRDTLQKVIKNYNQMITTDEHPVFIIETVEEGIDTVRSAMIRFIYDFDLAKNHQIYFVSSSKNSLEDQLMITQYLKKNAWPGVYWINNIVPESAGNRSPFSGRFFGLKQRSPNHYSIKRITKTSLPIEDIPVTYDMRYENSNLHDFMSFVYDQGACGSCWAISAAEIIGASLCKANPKFCDHQISAQDILSCIGQGTYGCSGAYMGDALLGMQRMGCVSDECLPYINGNCQDLAAHGAQCQNEYGTFVPTAASCRTTCYNNTLKHPVRYISDVLWLNAGYRSSNSIKLTERIIQEHIITYGPVIAGIEVYRDFEDFKQFDKVYTHTYDPRSSILGGHAIIISGWGIDEDIHGNLVPYWLAKNSWGTYWGNKGYFKIIRGSLKSPYVEDEIYGIIPNI